MGMKYQFMLSGGEDGLPWWGGGGDARLWECVVLLFVLLILLLFAALCRWYGDAC